MSVEAYNRNVVGIFAVFCVMLFFSMGMYFGQVKSCNDSCVAAGFVLGDFVKYSECICRDKEYFKTKR